MILSKNYKNIPASSIVETVIALSILSICSAVAFMIFFNVVKHTESLIHIKAKIKVEALHQYNTYNNITDNDKHTYPSFEVLQKVEVDESMNVVLYNYQVLVNESKIEELDYLNINVVYDEL